jgi:hypothetical protein
MTRGRLLVAPPLILATLSACAGPPPRLGATPADAQHNVGEALGALASRFGPVEREPAYDALRPRLLRASLAPSRIFDDPAAWTERKGEARGVGFAGFRVEGRYRMGVRAEPPSPSAAADYRGWLSLRRLGTSEFEWSVVEQLGLGPIPPDGLPAGVSALLRAAEANVGSDLGPRVRSLLPHAAKALGRGMTLEALRLDRDGAGSTGVFAAARLDLDALGKAYPSYASYLRSDSLPIRFRLELRDGGGATFWVMEGREGRYTLRARIRDGHLVPLQGPARPLPERLRLRLDITSKAGILRYGLEGLEGDLRLRGRPGEKGLEVAFRREPRWVMPFLVKPLLRASLRCPFQGEGASLAYALRENGSGLTVVSRGYRVAVKESWLLRWIGGNTGELVARFREGAEAEADQFTADALRALRADLIALFGARPPDAPPPGDRLSGP